MHGAPIIGTMEHGRGPRERDHGDHPAGADGACPACRLLRARRRLGLTQEEMARRLAVSTRTYCSMERAEQKRVSAQGAALRLAELLAAAAPERGSDA